MKEVDVKELVSATPVEAPVTPMTRRDKLLRLAHVARTAPAQYHGGFVIFSNLEYMDDHQLGACVHPWSLFHAAGLDLVLRAQGLKQDNTQAVGDTGFAPSTSAREAKRFFELTQDELHAFSCDCGGAISRSEIADRIKRIADGRNALGF